MQEKKAESNALRSYISTERQRARGRDGGAMRRGGGGGCGIIKQRKRKRASWGEGGGA